MTVNELLKREKLYNDYESKSPMIIPPEKTNNNNDKESDVNAEKKQIDLKKILIINIEYHDSNINSNFTVVNHI